MQFYQKGVAAPRPATAPVAKAPDVKGMIKQNNELIAKAMAKAVKPMLDRITALERRLSALEAKGEDRS